MINIFKWQVYNFVEKPRKLIIHWYKSYIPKLWGNRKNVQVWVNVEANSWRLMVSVFNWEVIFQINHMIEKIWWWGMITKGVKSPDTSYLEAKNKKWADMEATYITLLYHIRYNIILVFQLILRNGNAVLISLITKKM